MHNIKSEGERCLKCKVPQCSAHCPVRTPIPEITKAFLLNDINKAGELLFNNNPLSAITSVVCPHERNCAGHCVLGIKSEPIAFFEIEQYISQYYIQTFEPPHIEKNGKKVAVVGAGPSGITMSIKLALNGYDVTLFEAEDNIGGVLRYGIPDFRLSKRLVETYRTVLEKLGVKLRFHTRIGTNINTEDLFVDGYKAVYLGLGTGRPNKLGLLGETLGHVHFAIDFLKSPQTYNLGEKVVVVGAGNVAMDAARCAVRVAHAKVTVLNRNSAEDAPAGQQEVDMAMIDGVQFIHNCQAVRITDKTVRCVAVNRIEEPDGKVTYEEDFSNTFEVEADSVILAIGQGPSAEIKYGSNMNLSARGLIATDENGETSTPNVFAGGDVVSGPSTVVQAVASTLRVADYLLEKLKTL